MPNPVQMRARIKLVPTEDGGRGRSRPIYEGYRADTYLTLEGFVSTQNQSHTSSQVGGYCACVMSMDTEELCPGEETEAVMQFLTFDDRSLLPPGTELGLYEGPYKVMDIEVLEIVNDT